MNDVITAQDIITEENQTQRDLVVLGDSEGNYLLFSQPPREVDHVKWRELFVQEIGAPPEVEHQTFGWDSPGRMMAKTG